METPARRNVAQNIMSPIPEDKEKNQSTNQTNENIQKRSAAYAGPYRLMESLGKGGLATVKVGVDQSGQKVAVKIVEKTKLANPREQVSMAREITIMKLLKHPNILRLYDVYENSERIFLILDIYEGGDLYGHLTRYGAMRPSEALILFRQLTRAIDFCHKNLIVHRDLKPENLLLSRDKKTLVLSDFGLSTGMAGSRSLLKTRCGTVHYISPEVAKGDPYVGMASDVWSCGIILFAMVTASLPFDGETSIIVLKKIVKGDYIIPHHLPPDLKDLIKKMLAPDPSTRITIPLIRQHPWFKMGATKEDLMDTVLPAISSNISSEQIQQNQSIVENLKLLGWEEEELKEDLLSEELNQAKFFFTLLLDHKKSSNSRQKGPTSPLSPENRPRASSTDSTTVSKRHKPEEMLEETKPIKENEVKNIETKEHKELITTKDNNKDKEHAETKECTNKRKSKEYKEKRLSRDDKENRENRNEENVQASKENSSNDEKLNRRPSFLRAPLRRPATVDNRSRQRAATVGDEKPDIVSARPREGSWGISPANDPEAKIYSVESRKSLNQILDSLRSCFHDLELEFSEKKQKKDVVKVKGRLSTGKVKKTQVIVEVKITENGNVVHFKRSGKKSTKKEDFKEVCKKIEETLIV